MAKSPSTASPVTKAWIAAAIIGVLVGGLCFVILTAHNSVKPDVGAGDFQWSLRAARDLVAGQDIYRYPPGPHAIPYPLPAALAAMPLAWMPDVIAGSVFIGISVMLLAFGIIRSGEEWRLAMLLSWSFVYALLWVQWTPLIAALWYLPALAAVLCVKPNIVLPLLLSQGDRVLANWKKWILPPVAVFAVSLALYPMWPLIWLRQLGTYQGTSPPLFSMPLGPLVLLAFAGTGGWRDRRAWLLVTLALMPQRMVYDQLAIMLVPARRWQLWILIAMSWVNCAIFFQGNGWGDVPMGWQNFLLATLYLPAVAMIALPGLLQRLPATMKVHARSQSRQAALGIPHQEGRDSRTPGGVHRGDDGEVQSLLPDVSTRDA